MVQILFLWLCVGISTPRVLSLVVQSPTSSHGSKTNRFATFDSLSQGPDDNETDRTFNEVQQQQIFTWNLSWHGFEYSGKPAELDDFLETYRKAVHKTLDTEGVKEPYPCKIGQRAASTKPLIWLHVHHEMGTSVCLTAIANGDRVVSPSCNCGWTGFDGYTSLGAKGFAPPTCQKRAKYFSRWNFTLGMIERELYATDICDGFRYATVIRDPIDFVDSLAHFRYDLMFEDYRDQLGGQKHKDWMDDMIKKVFQDGTFVFKETKDKFIYGWQLLDNYHIRAILGEDAFRVGPGKINSTHLAKAKDRLSRFDFVKTLEPGETWDSTSNMLGWRPVLNSPANARDEHSRYLSATALAFLQELNQYDVELYKSFKGTVSADDAHWK